MRSRPATSVLLIAWVLTLPLLAAGQEREGREVEVDGGLGRGITITSADGRSSMNIRVRFQARATEFMPLSNQDDWATEFLIRRSRVVFQGNLFGESWRYYVQYGFANPDLEPDLRVPLRDAYLNWRAARDFQLRVGQMKVPFDRQRVISSSALQFADRSLITSELNLDRDVGIQALSTDLFGLGERLGYQLGLFGGHGRNRLETAPGVLVVGRLQVTPFGSFDDYIEADLERLDRLRLAVGAGVARNTNTNRARSTFGEVYQFARFDYDHAEADLMLKWRGLGVLAQVLYRKADRGFEEDTTGPDPSREFSRSGWGWFVQSGYMATAHLEISGRYGELRPIETTAPDLVFTREVGGAVSWYFQRHDFKLQGDWFTFLDDRRSGGTHQARVQLQLFF